MSRLPAWVRAVSFVGCALSGLLVGAPPAGAWSSAHGWTRLDPPASPPARAGHVMAYEPVGRDVVVFGGYQDVGYLDDTWMWDGTTWTQSPPSVAPSPRAGAGMAYDRVTKQLVLFGGFNGSSYLGDTWTGTDRPRRGPSRSPPLIPRR